MINHKRSDVLSKFYNLLYLESIVMSLKPLRKWTTEYYRMYIANKNIKIP